MVILFGLKIIIIICLSTFAISLQHALPCQLALAVMPVKSSGYRISTAVDLSSQFPQVSNKKDLSTLHQCLWEPPILISFL